MTGPIRRFSTGLILLVILAGACVLPLYFTGRWVNNHSRRFAYEFEQALAALHQAPAQPGEALLDAQAHLAAARAELNTLQPVVGPAAGMAAHLSGWPLLGPPARQWAGLWDLAEATTTAGENLVGAAQIGQVNFEANGVAGLMAALPAIKTSVQAAQTQLARAGVAREQVGPVDPPGRLAWLPADEAARLETALAQWDSLSPPLAEALATVNQLLTDIDLAQAQTDLQTLADELQQVSALVNQLEDGQADPVVTLKAALQRLTAAQIAFNSLRPVATPVIDQADRLASILADTPPLAGNLPAAGQLTAWWRFTEAAMLLSQNLTAVVELGFLNVDQAGMDGVLAAMPAIQEQLLAAQNHLAQAQAARAALQPVDWLPPDMAAPLNETVARWDEVAPTLANVVPKAEPLARILPLLLGSDKPVTYLLMIQSSTELRPSGGFLGSIGLITLDNGKITNVDLHEVVEVDHPWEAMTAREWPGRIPPPFGLQRYMGMIHWYVRDGNWWADFPETARQVRDLWSLEHSGEIDGVIAMTDQGVIHLLQALGPVETITGETVSAENGLAFAAEQLYQQERAGGINPQTRLLQEMGLTFAILTRDLSAGQVLQLARFLQQAAPRKDFLMTSFDPPLAYALNQLGIDGALQGQQDDYFYLVESNISVNKSSQFIRQNLNYDVTLTPSGWPGRARLTVEESNLYRPEDKIPGFPENVFNGLVWPFPAKREERLRPEGYYGGFTRLFPPPGSTFNAVIGFDDGPYIMEESHRTVASGYMGLYAGEQQQLQFEWTPPNGQPSEAGRYRLRVQRQPGAPEHALSVVAELPPGYQATEVSPAPISTSAGQVTWQAVLDRDQTFSLRLVSDADARAAATATAAPPARPDPAITPTAPLTAALTSAPDSPRPVVAAATPEPFRAPLPVWLSIPAIGVGAAVVPVGLEPSGIMASPTEADLAGWYELGPRPGEWSNAVIAAHVDWLGQEGAFARLNELQPGDTIEVLHGPNSGFKFVVESIQTYQADAAPVADIFGPTPTQPTLTLITCDGPYDYRRQEYRDRLVVRARGMN